MRGTVTEFDADVGLGEITAADGTHVAFHCVVIADGSRNIAVGARVEFELMPRLGRYEACNVTPA